MPGARRPLSGWITAAAALALAALALGHDRRDDRRFAELVQRIDEVRLLQSSAHEARDPRVPTLPMGHDELAERVANRLLAALGQRGASSAAVVAPVEEPEPAPPRSAEQERLLAQADELAERAIRDGQLRRNDVLRLRDIFNRVSATAEQHELRDRIVKAINAQQLSVEDPAFVLF